METATRYSVTVPLADNDGTPIPLDVLLAIETRILNMAGGFTRATVVGAWRPDDRLEDADVVYDESRVYSFDVAQGAPYDGVPVLAAQLRGLAQFVAVACDQDCVYVTRETIAREFVPQPELG